MSNKFKFYSLALSLLSLNSMAIELNEKTLVEWAKSDSFKVKMLALESLSTSQELSQFNDNFGYSADVSFSHAETKETSFSANIPISSPTTATAITITKPTKYGVNASLTTFANQNSNALYKDGSTTGYGAGLSIDLYKDIMGRTTRAQEKSLTLRDKISKKEREITTHAYIQEVRKLYWKLVANNESLKIAKELLNTAKRLEKDTTQRVSNNIADSGELARTKSQVQARSGQILLLEYERSNLVQALKELFPEQLKNQNIELGKYSLSKTLNSVLSCTQKISAQDSIPKSYTLYDEVLTMMREDLDLSKKVNSTYSMADLKLISEVKYLGKDFSYSDSYDELKGDGKKSYNVGLQLVIPLGSTAKKTETIRKEIIQKKNISRYQEIEGKLSAFHSQTIKSIAILNKVIAAQEMNSSYLSQSLKDSKKKFKQARLSTRDLMQDENAYLQSNLDEINTQYNVIKTLVDYFSVFSKTPCEINL